MIMFFIIKLSLINILKIEIYYIPMPRKDKLQQQIYHKQYYKKNRDKLLKKQRKYVETRDKIKKNKCNFSLKIRRGKFLINFN